MSIRHLALLATLLAFLALSACKGIGYTEEDLENNRRQDFFGYILGLEEK